MKAVSQNEKCEGSLAKDSAVGNVFSNKKFSNTFYVFANRLAGV